jgi:hypothetical protein
MSDMSLEELLIGVSSCFQPEIERRKDLQLHYTKLNLSTTWVGIYLQLALHCFTC